MNKRKSIINSIFYTLLIILFPVISGIIVSVLKINNPYSILIQAIAIFISIILALIIIKIKHIEISNYISNNSYSWLIYLPLIILYIPLSIKGFEWKGLEYFLYTFLLYFFVGISEELFFRLIIVNELKKSFNNIKLIIYSILLFGLGHGVVILNGTGLLLTILTIINALIFGFMAIVLILKTNNIIPLMIAHFLFDFESKFILIDGSELIIAEFIRGTIMLVYTIILLNIKKEEKNE